MDITELNNTELDRLITLTKVYRNSLDTSEITALDETGEMLQKLEAIRAEWDDDDPWAEDKRLLAALRDHRTELEDYLLDTPASNFSASMQTLSERRQELVFTQELLTAIIKKMGNR